MGQGPRPEGRKEAQGCGGHAQNAGAQNEGAVPQGEDEKAPRNSCGLTRAREMNVFGTSREGGSGERISLCALVA